MAPLSFLFSLSAFGSRTSGQWEEEEGGGGPDILLLLLLVPPPPEDETNFPRLLGLGMSAYGFTRFTLTLDRNGVGAVDDVPMLIVALGLPTESVIIIID